MLLSNIIFIYNVSKIYASTQKGFFKNKIINNVIIGNILRIISLKYLKKMCLVSILKYNAHQKNNLMPLLKDGQSVSHLVGHC